jgi:putative addiction module component (TIGR02574 family)
MSHADIDTVLGQALRMPEEERAEIAEKLIASLEDSPDSAVEEAWQEEVARRIRDLESGAVVGIPWEEVRRRLRDKAS